VRTRHPARAVKGAAHAGHEVFRTLTRVEVSWRAARPDEADALSALALASKGHWGYDQDFLDACRDELTVDEADLPRIVVAETDRPVGWYSLRGTPPDGELDNLWVHPSAIGTGIGRGLWEHAVRSARDMGMSCLRIEADPQAEGFYRAMGAGRVGDAPSGSIAGRIIPLMRFDVPDARPDPAT
jgi:GNAT superfamily N-acetyltransferase